MKSDIDESACYFKIGTYASPADELPFHKLEGLPNMEGWMDEFPEQYVWLARTTPVRQRWQPLPSLVQKSQRLPKLFIHGSEYNIAFPEHVTSELSKRFPNQFEWLPVNVRGEDAEDFKPPFVSALSKKVAAMRLHILHCTRPVRLAEHSEVEEFAPRGKQKKRDVASFMNVETYGLRRKDVAGLNILFLQQDLSLICTDTFRGALKELKLTGIAFEPIRVVIV